MLIANDEKSTFCLEGRKKSFILLTSAGSLSQRMWQEKHFNEDGWQAGRQATKSKYIFLETKKKWGETFVR